MWRDTAGIEGYLRDDRETWCSGNSLKHKKVILMRSPNNVGYGFLTGPPLLAEEVAFNIGQVGHLKIPKQFKLLII